MISLPHLCVTAVSLATLIICQGQAAAQSAPTTGTTTTTAAKPTTMSLRLQVFHKRMAEIDADLAALPADTTGTVVMLGDSITEGFRAKELAGWRVMNQGINSDAIRITNGEAGGVASRIDRVKAARPAHIFLLIGINDFGANKPVDTAEAHYREVVKALREAAPDATLHLQTILPTGGKYARLNVSVNEMNKRIVQIAKENNLDLIDLHAVMADEKNELKPAFTHEGLHLTAPAYAAWEKVVVGRLE